jgi:hypothetical protein
MDPFPGVVQIRVTPKTRNPFTIKALSISDVTWNWHVLNHAGFSGGEGGGWSRNRLIPCQLVAMVVAVTPAKDWMVPAPRPQSHQEPAWSVSGSTLTIGSAIEIEWVSR